MRVVVAAMDCDGILITDDTGFVNRIEHRLFSHISMNWRGRPLTSLRREMGEKNKRMRELEMERDVFRRCMALWVR
ncbi:hypothetical protein OG769_36275 (plasmid) [Streptomyces sp. NBC_01435]|nr:hypothetical protein [Streptomyces sp. NBC_01435]